MKRKDYKYEKNDLMQLDKLTIESVEGDLEIILPEKYMPTEVTQETIETYKRAIEQAIKDDKGSQATLAGLDGIDNAEAYQFYAEFGAYAVACEAHQKHNVDKNEICKTKTVS